MKMLGRKALALLLALAIVLPSVAGGFPRVAHAQLITFSPLEYEALMQMRIKDAGLLGGALSLDGLAWILAKVAISSMTKSLVNWINSGFEGSPAFATDLRYNLLRVGDAVASRLFDELTDEIIDTPYRDEIATAIRTGYYLQTGGALNVRNPFTLDQYSTNPADYLAGNFSQGGLSAWFSTFMNAQNNPYGAYNLALQELDSRLAQKGAERITELNWGRGFMSWRGECAQTLTGANQAAVAEYAGSANGADMVTLLQTQNASLADEEGCLDYSIQTPGSVIEGQLNQVLPSGMEGLITADEINEIVGALFQQLVVQVIGKTGLRAVSAPSSGGGRPYLDQATDPNQYQTGQGGSGQAGSAPTSTFSDPDAEAQLSVYEASWNKVEDLAVAASQKCPESTVARQALRDALSAGARVDAARQAMRQPGVTADQVRSFLPSDADVTAAQAAASDTDGSTAKQLVGIMAARGCPSN